MKIPFNSDIADQLRRFTERPTDNPLARSLVDKICRQHGLVSRDEFDAQARLLAASETRIAELEAQLAELELKLTKK